MKVPGMTAEVFLTAFRTLPKKEQDVFFVTGSAKRSLPLRTTRNPLDRRNYGRPIITD